jgi:AcrR family transcriptional regulator
MSMTLRQKQGAESRDRILDAAVEIIFENGYSATSMAALRARSSLTASSIYWHFGSKDGVVAAVVERESERYFAELPHWEDTEGPDVLTRFTTYMEAVGAAAIEEPRFFRVLVTLAMEPADISEQTIESIRKVRQGGLEFLLGPVGDVVAAVGSTKDPVEIATFCFAVLEGSAIGRRVDPDHISIPVVYRQVAQAAIALARAED